jgi:hypothetical protein
VPEKRNESDVWPKRDEVSDEDGPHSSRDIPHDRAEDARSRTGKSRSQDVDPDSAESAVDRDDAGNEA